MDAIWDSIVFKSAKAACADADLVSRPKREFLDAEFIHMFRYWCHSYCGLAPDVEAVLRPGLQAMI